jgi:hypothetical protein
MFEVLGMDATEFLFQGWDIPLRIFVLWAFDRRETATPFLLLSVRVMKEHGCSAY